VNTWEWLDAAVVQTYGQVVDSSTSSWSGC